MENEKPSKIIDGEKPKRSRKKLLQFPIYRRLVSKQEWLLPEDCEQGVLEYQVPDKQPKPPADKPAPKEPKND